MSWIGPTALHDAMWCWWTRPRAFEHAGKLYLGTESAIGGIEVIEIDGQSAERWLLADHETDDHNNPALLIAAGKPAIAFYARHGQDALLRYRIASQDIETSLGPFDAEATITMAAAVTYAEAHAVGDTVYVICRTLDAWSLVVSTDWGATWGTPVTLFDFGGLNGKPYIATRLLGDGVTLRCAFFAHFSNPGTVDAWYCEINLTTGAISTTGGTLGNINGTNLPVDIYDTEQVTAFTGGRRAWVYDVSGGQHPAVALVSTDPEGADPAGDAMYHYATRASGSWVVEDVVAAGGSYPSQPGAENENKPYFGGIQFDGDNTLLSRKTGGVWVVERWDTTDNGATFTTTEIARSGSSELTGDEILARVFPIEGSTDPKRTIAYCRYWNYQSYNDYDGWLVLDGDP